MSTYYKKGKELKEQIKQLVYEFMSNSSDCKPYADGLTQAVIFRECGLDWGSKENATSSNQQYWIIALLRQLEQELKVQRDPLTKRWRIR